MFVIKEKPSQKGLSTETVVQAIAVPTIDEELPDGGLRAWLVVIGCFVVNAVTLGFSWVPRCIFPTMNSPISFPAL